MSSKSFDRLGRRARRPVAGQLDGGSGSILRPSIADDAEAFAEQVVRERVAGRPEADDQHVLAVVRQRVRARAR